MEIKQQRYASNKTRAAEGAAGGPNGTLALIMPMLLLGVVVFLGVHSVRIVADGRRTAQTARPGTTYPPGTAGCHAAFTRGRSTVGSPGAGARSVRAMQRHGASTLKDP